MWEGCDCCDYKEDCGWWFQRWLQKSLSSSCPFILCEQPLPSRDGAYFASSCIWVALRVPLTTRMWQKWCPTSEVRPPEPWHLLINFQKEIDLLPPWEEAQSRLLNVGRPHGERSHMEGNQGALCDRWHNVLWMRPSWNVQPQSSQTSQLHEEQKWAIPAEGRPAKIANQQNHEP